MDDFSVWFRFLYLLQFMENVCVRVVFSMFSATAAFVGNYSVRLFLPMLVLFSLHSPTKFKLESTTHQ